MTFSEAVKDGFDHYTKFDGRAGRPAFWWWFLFGILVWIGANIIDAIHRHLGVVNGLAALALLLPGSRRDPPATRHRPQRLVDPDLHHPASSAASCCSFVPARGRSG